MSFAQKPFFLFVQRLVFVYLVSVIVVLASERAYWNIETDVFGVALAYAIAVWGFLWAVEHFQARSVPRVFLCAVVFGLLVEGVIAAQLYGGFPFDPFTLTYTSLAWHAPFSVMLFFYYFRKWLIERAIKPLVLSAIGFGALWGNWMGVSSFLEDTDEVFSEMFSVAEFTEYAFLMTIFLILAHLLLNFFWIDHFKPSRIEHGLMIIFGLVFFITIPVLSGYFYAPLVLGVYLALTFFLLKFKKEESSLFSALKGKASVLYLPILLLMPLTASGTYALTTTYITNEEVLGGLGLLHIGVQSLAGYILVFLALYYIFRKKKVSGEEH